MDSLSILLIALVLALDAFAVAVAGWAVVMEERLKIATNVALLFGGFQALMPVIGWFGGSQFIDAVSGYDHWVAFCLLALIGAKMIRDSSTTAPGEKAADILDHRILAFLAVATSIDALAAGVTFAFLEVSILHSVAVIGVVTFVLPFVPDFFSLWR
ncbi:manganese efflux pump MntP [Candidatus Methanocrinis natronophilus]|uniref:Manganese efflux pump MntP family protein n=1 Tax=Candidatus Methanocrinis natronophilus TaxID=3033396 RepID=A0ABT5X680_9EURY|nr:manganese efflux pump MntP family protein [Candidatus Methanocrinis natronophilus]MDF0590205.1 manganese efflux pump MntP family protein [Candidatus Methanocrinis natronophilus]